MNSQEFFWYVFPWLVTGSGVCWLIYDKYVHRER